MGSSSLKYLYNNLLRAWQGESEMGNSALA
jgi:hypothetical protein